MYKVYSIKLGLQLPEVDGPRQHTYQPFELKHISNLCVATYTKLDG